MALWAVLAVLAIAFLIVIVAMIVSHRFREDMLAGRQTQTKFLGFFTVKGAAFVVLEMGLAALMIYVGIKLGERPPWPPPPPPPQVDPAEQAIRDYYEAINRGLEGEGGGFIEAWAFLSGSAQKRKSRQYPDHSFPNDYARLYSRSGHHKLLEVRELAGTSESRRSYMVVLTLTEGHVENPLLRYFSAQTTKRLKDWPKDLAVDTICQDIMESLASNYDIASAAKAAKVPEEQLKARIKEKLLEDYSNRVVGPRLVTQVAAAFKLSLKAGPRGDLPGGGLRHYDVVESYKVEVTKVGADWRLSRFFIRGCHANAVIRE